MNANLFVVGGQRCGTSTLYSYLESHRDIFMSTPKEPLYHMAHGAGGLQAKTMAIRNRSAYDQLFESASTRYRGEASATYLACPWVPRRLQEYAPDAKLIAILRNPVDRAWSHFQLHQGQAKPMFGREFRCAMSQSRKYTLDGQSWDFNYVTLGFYSEQIARFQAIFPASAFKILLFEQLVSAPEAMLEEIREFLALEASFDLVPRHTNKSSPAVRSKLLHSISTRLPKPIRARVERRNTRVLNCPNVVRRKLQRIYREDIEKVSKLIGKDLRHWLE